MITIKIMLPQNHENIIFEIPEDKIGYILDIEDHDSIKNLKETLIEKLDDPIGIKKLSDLIDSDNKILVVIDDISRETPVKKILPTIIGYLNKIGIEDNSIEILIGIGTHRYMSRKEIADRVGDKIGSRIKIYNNEWRNKDSFVFLGNSKTGIPIEINKKVKEFDFIIGIGSIIPHTIVGWSGGGKIIQPGICSLKTTEKTHLLALKEGIVIGKLNTKLRQEIDEISLKAGLRMIVNCILNKNNEIVDVVVGDPLEAHRRGVELAKKIYERKIKEKQSIVIINSFPKNLDFWQSMKALFSASLYTKNGGTIVWVNYFLENKTHPELLSLLKKDGNILLKMIDDKKTDKIALTVAILTKKISKSNTVYLITNKLSKREIEEIGFEHAESIEEVLKISIKKYPYDKICIVKREGVLVNCVF